MRWDRSRQGTREEARDPQREQGAEHAKGLPRNAFWENSGVPLAFLRTIFARKVCQRALEAVSCEDRYFNSDSHCGSNNQRA